MENFIKSSIDLFNTVPVDEDTIKIVNSKDLIEHGYFLDGENVSDRVKNILIEKSFQINKTFYAKWNDILLKNRNQLLIDQLFHYATVWVKHESSKNNDFIYIPQDFSGWTIPLRILKQETKIEIKNKAKLMLYANIALKEETILNIFNIISFDEIEVDKVKNRDSKILIQTKLHIIPKTAEDLMKCLIYSITGSLPSGPGPKNLVFVKNKELQNIISEKATLENALFWIKNNEITLSQIFNRYKNVFLSMKKNNDLKSYINKISHLSKKNHIPVSLRTSMPSNGFQMTRYLKYLIKEKQPRSFIIRNGKIWCERNKFEKISTYKQNIKKILNAYSLKQSPHTKIALPTSEKNFIGNYPMGSEFNHKKLIIGIYWKNNENRVDLDLSCVDIVGKIGWDSHYYRDKIIFSGDITDAPNGANEYLNLGSIETPKLIQVNYYNFSSNKHEVEFDIIVGFNDKLEEGPMLRSENIIVSMKTSINSSKTKTLGVVYPGGRFVVIDKYIGKKVQTNGVEKIDMQILIDSFTNNLFFEDFIARASADERSDPPEGWQGPVSRVALQSGEVAATEWCDAHLQGADQNKNTQEFLDLRTEFISKDKILSIFN